MNTKQHPWPNFRNALLDLAPTNRERAEMLGCSERTVAYYLSGLMLPPVEKVKRYPSLDRALTLDVAPHIDHAAPAESVAA
jgi:hypothetical protein